MKRVVVSLLLMPGLIACGNPVGVSEAEDGGLTDGGRPSPYIFPEGDPPIPSLPVTNMGAAIKGALQTILTIRNRSSFEVYQALLNAGDGMGCPGMARTVQGGQTNVFWQAMCETAGGVGFRGFGALVIDQDVPGEGGSLINGWYLYMDGRLADRSGHSIDGAGVAADISATTQYGTYYQRQVNGTLLVTGGSENGPWYDGSRRATLTVTAIHGNSPVRANAITIEGGLTDLSGAVDTVMVSGVGLKDGVLGSSCAKEPSGTISLRTPNDEWYDVAFDGPTDAAPDVPLALCDGCGQAYFRGQPLGQVCLDFDFLLDWGNSPW